MFPTWVTMVWSWWTIHVIQSAPLLSVHWKVSHVSFIHNLVMIHVSHRWCGEADCATWWRDERVVDRVSLSHEHLNTCLISSSSSHLWFCSLLMILLRVTRLSSSILTMTLIHVSSSSHHLNHWIILPGHHSTSVLDSVVLAMLVQPRTQLQSAATSPSQSDIWKPRIILPHCHQLLWEI